MYLCWLLRTSTDTVEHVLFCKRKEEGEGERREKRGGEEGKEEERKRERRREERGKEKEVEKKVVRKRGEVWEERREVVEKEMEKQ